MNISELKQQIKDIDIYLLDQILKDRFIVGKKILDAGCGNGRNLKWFYHNNYSIFGVDTDLTKIELNKKKYPNQTNHFSVNSLENLPQTKAFFDHIICNAVLHFAKNERHFFKMFSELIRVLTHNGTLFIRMASVFGLEHKIISIGNGRYNLPDGTERFLLTKNILHKITTNYNITFIEPIKTVNVDNKRCMTTLVIQKKKS